VWPEALSRQAALHPAPEPWKAPLQGLDAAPVRRRAAVVVVAAWPDAQPAAQAASGAAVQIAAAEPAVPGAERVSQPAARVVAEARGVRLAALRPAVAAQADARPEAAPAGLAALRPEAALRV
jgi:hypothetical protein